MNSAHGETVRVELYRLLPAPTTKTSIGPPERGSTAACGISLSGSGTLETKRRNVAGATRFVTNEDLANIVVIEVTKLRVVNRLVGPISCFSLVMTTNRRCRGLSSARMTTLNHAAARSSHFLKHIRASASVQYSHSCARSSRHAHSLRSSSRRGSRPLTSIDKAHRVSLQAQQDHISARMLR